MADIRYAVPGDEPALQELWSLCFPGDEAYCSFFMAELYQPENALAAVDGGQVIAMLHQLPAALASPSGEPLAARYLYAIGTRPGRRGQGISAALMDQAFFDMHLRGDAAALLVPGSASLFEFYKRFGFEPLFEIPTVGADSVRPSDQQMPVGAATCRPPLRTAGENDIPRLSEIYDSNTRSRVRVTRTAGWWALLLREQRVTGGRVLLNDSEYVVLDGNDNVREQLSADAAAIENTASRPYGMGRVVEAQAAQRWAGLPADGAIDEFCPWNTHPGSVLDDRQLTRMVLRSGYMNLMHD